MGVPKTNDIQSNHGNKTFADFGVECQFIWQEMHRVGCSKEENGNHELCPKEK